MEELISSLLGGRSLVGLLPLTLGYIDLAVNRRLTYGARLVQRDLGLPQDLGSSLFLDSKDLLLVRGRTCCLAASASRCTLLGTYL